MSNTGLKDAASPPSDGHRGSFPLISFRMVDDAGPVKKLVRFECTYLTIIWFGVFLGLLLRRRARMAEDHFESADDQRKGVSSVAQTIHSPETAETRSHANGRSCHRRRSSFVALRAMIGMTKFM